MKMLAVAIACAADDPSRVVDSPPALPPAEVRAWQTGLARPDRLEHASLAFTLGLALGAATRDPAVPALAVSALGAAKELADRRTTGFDLLDLAADGIGIAAATAFTTLWRK